MIDIIIAAYNAHETIEKTLLSICLQTIKNKINVVIVDDCSKTNYSKIVEKFKGHLNIKEIRLEKNSGPGVARQYGLDNSNSEYIMFADSDDVFYDCFSIENIYKKMLNSDYELATGILCCEEKDTIDFYNYHTVCLHANMYRRSYIEKYNLRFPDTRTSEDLAFNTLYLLSQPKTLYEESITYIYRYNSNSITRCDETNYLFTMMELYIYNSVWAIEQAEVRNFDSYEIAKYMFIACMVTYYRYIQYIHREDLNLLFKWFTPLLKMYQKYIIYLNEEDKYKLYNMYPVWFLPKVSFYDFINIAQLHCNYN